MPLLPPLLAERLTTLDDPSPGSDVLTSATRWFEAFWAYYSGCTLLQPLTLEAAKLAAQAVFVPLLAAGMTPNPVPVTFFLALEGAIRAVLAVTLTPAFLLPGFGAGVPTPAPLAPLLLAVVPLGLASGSAKPPARIAAASIISAWMVSNTVTLLSPPGVVPLL